MIQHFHRFKTLGRNSFLLKFWHMSSLIIKYITKNGTSSFTPASIYCHSPRKPSVLCLMSSQSSIIMITSIYSRTIQSCMYTMFPLLQILTNPGSQKSCELWPLSSVARSKLSVLETIEFVAFILTF